VTASAAIYGRLGRDPEQRTSQAGNPWATATLAVNLAEEDDAPPVWFGVTAFGKVAEILCRHSKGDLISVSGRLQLSRWRDQQGLEREQLRIIADTVISAKSVRQGGGRERQE
jgi:single-strand DNA-binding protein